jgi:hypothetical protein
MSVTVGGVVLKNLQAQPLGYEQSAVTGGVTARQWTIQGLVTGAEWVAILGVYDTWRNAKIQEDPATSSKVLGTTVSFSGTGYGSQTWTNVACWFNAAPSGSQANGFVSVSFGLVDATQALQVIVKQETDQEAAEEADQAINYGNITLGGVVVKFLEDPDVFVDTPQVNLTATGKHYATGPLIVSEGLSIRGEIIGTAKTQLRNWFRTTAQASPVPGQYWPTDPPTFRGINKLVNGATVLHYEVSLNLIKVL